MSWNLFFGLTNAAKSLLEHATHAEAHYLEKERAQVTLNSIGDAVISTDLAGRITYLNPVAVRVTGWSLQDAAGRLVADVLRLVDGDNREPAPNPMSLAILGNAPVALRANTILIRRDGRELPVEDTAAPIHDRTGRVVGAVIVFRDVSVARAALLRMSHLAQHDYLTDLPNRLLLNDRLERAIAAADRRHQTLAVLFVDVDRFKDVNDRLGHAIGDQLLQSIAVRLVTCVRASDTVSRLGGDEFVIVLCEISRAEDAAVTADKILAAVGTPHRIGDQDLRVMVSVGISVFPDDGAEAELLLKNADVALRNAKAGGRSNRRFFDERINPLEVAPSI